MKHSSHSVNFLIIKPRPRIFNNKIRQQIYLIYRTNTEVWSRSSTSSNKIRWTLITKSSTELIRKRLPQLLLAAIFPLHGIWEKVQYSHLSLPSRPFWYEWHNPGIRYLLACACNFSTSRIERSMIGWCLRHILSNNPCSKLILHPFGMSYAGRLPMCRLWTLTYQVSRTLT